MHCATARGNEFGERFGLCIGENPKNQNLTPKKICPEG